MIISVTSPVRQAGCTTTAALVGLLLAAAHKSVCLTHLSTPPPYLGMDAGRDKTCSPSQVAKLLREGAIEPHDMADYCIRYNDTLDIFAGGISAEDMELTYRYILDNMPHDFIVIDTDTDSPLARMADEKADLTIVCLTQSASVLDGYAAPERTALHLCNHYSQTVGSVSAFAAAVGAKKRDCLPLHHSPMLMKLANDGKLGDIIKLADNLPLPDIAADLKRLSDAVLRRYKAVIGGKK